MLLQPKKELINPEIPPDKLMLSAVEVKGNMKQKKRKRKDKDSAGD